MPSSSSIRRQSVVPEELTVVSKAPLKFKAVKRNGSPSWLSSMNPWKTSSDDSSTDTLMDVSDHQPLGASVSSSTLNCCSLKGCLKYPSQAVSLNHPYLPPSSSRTPDSSPDESKKVGWGSLTIHSHEVLLGDNVCTSGPPVTIGWKAFETATVTILDYESVKPMPRDKGQMVLPRSVREDILRRAGFSRSSLNEASVRVSEVQANRRRSSHDGRFIQRFSALSRKSCTL